MTKHPISGINVGAGWVIPGPLRPVLAPLSYLLATPNRWRLVGSEGFPKTSGGVSDPVDGLMVPESSFRDLDVEAGEDLIVRAENPAVLDVRTWALQPKFFPGIPRATRVAVYGKREGRTSLIAYVDTRGRRERRRGVGMEVSLVKMAELKVSIKTPKSFAVRFWYLNDSGGNIASRRRAELPELLDRANLLFERQANVHFFDQHTFLDKEEMELKLDSVDFGRAVSRPEFFTHILPRIREVHDPTVDVHIVLVKKLDSTGPDGHRDDALTYSNSPDPRVILLQDVITKRAPPGKVLAHELGHALTLPHSQRLGYDSEGHSSDDADLMYAFCMADPRTMRIRLREADVINPSGL